MILFLGKVQTTFDDQCTANLVDSDLKKADNFYDVSNKVLCSPACFCKAGIFIYFPKSYTIDPKDFDSIPTKTPTQESSIDILNPAPVTGQIVMDPNGNSKVYVDNYPQCPSINPILVADTNFTNDLALGMKALGAVEHDF